MAGDWIKMEHALADKPEVLRMARYLGADRDLVLGKLFRFWAWADENSEDGVVEGVLPDDVDALVQMNGFAQALEQVGWLRVNQEKEQLNIPKFDRHNGESSKKRALKSKRQANWRSHSVDGGASTEPSTREEKRREEEIDSSFASWWALYPRKQAKGRARKAYRTALKKTGAEALEAAVQKYAAAVAETDKQYIKLPATWLNDEAWLDEPTHDTGPEPINWS